LYVVLVICVIPMFCSVTSVLQLRPLEKRVYESIDVTNIFSCKRNKFLFPKPLINWHLKGKAVTKESDRIKLRRWRKRGFYSETVLVKHLQKLGYNAVRIPVSNPSLSPLPDLMARKGEHTYAFEVKNASYYAYFPKPQIDKLIRFLNELIPGDNANKHAIIAAHLGKKWLFKEVSWEDWEKDKLPEKSRILKRDRGNFFIEKSY
jgi:Holliday junction resolvase